MSLCEYLIQHQSGITDTRMCDAHELVYAGVIFDSRKIVEFEKIVTISAFQKFDKHAIEVAVTSIRLFHKTDVVG